MFNLFREGGVMMWPLLILAVAVVVLSVRGWMRVSRVEGPDPVVETGVDAVVFWGAWSVILGFLGTIVGIYFAAGAISVAPAISPQIILGRHPRGAHHAGVRPADLRRGRGGLVHPAQLVSAADYGVSRPRVAWRARG